MKSSNRSKCCTDLSGDRYEGMAGGLGSNRRRGEAWNIGSGGSLRLNRDRLEGEEKSLSGDRPGRGSYLLSAESNVGSVFPSLGGVVPPRVPSELHRGFGNEDP